MNCERCQELLIEYAHDESEWVDREAISTHLGHCGECATAYCRLQVDLSDIAVAHAEAPSREVAARVREAAQREFAPSAWSRFVGFWSRPIPVYRAIAIGLVPVVLLLAAQGRGDEVEPEVEAPAAKTEVRLNNYDATVTPSIYRGVL